jgi:hypothetical protein
VNPGGATTRPIIVARRWDGLGARLNALVNAWSVARARGLEFRFGWPRGHEPWLDEPGELFGERFRRSFEIGGLEDRPFEEVVECYEVLRTGEEPLAQARARFRECFHDIEWSPAIDDVVGLVAGRVREFGAGIHVRAGDLASGAWRHHVMHEKYVPTPFSLLAIHALSGAGGDPVLVVSDNDACAAYLRQRVPAVCTPGDLLPGYSRLTVGQRALADLLLLSRCQRIVGPPHSAFSRLAANLGPGEIARADGFASQGNEPRLLLGGIAEATRHVARVDGLRPLLARDVCWFLDVFGDTLAPAERVRHGRRAVALEPDFCGALNRHARASALAGRHATARRASARALDVAGSVARHADPLVESLATSIGVGCLALTAGWGRRGIRPFARRHSPAETLDRLREALAHCERLRPYQLHRGGILVHLRYQIAAVEWLMSLDEMERQGAARALAPSNRDREDMRAWRVGGLINHRTVALFDPVVRDLDEITIRFARAIGQALARGRLGSAARVIGHVDGIETSASGLAWLHGWAFDVGTGGAPLAVGLGRDVGGPTFVVREDVAAALADPRALRSGFCFPIRRELAALAGALTPVVRTVSGAHVTLAPS